MFPVKLDRPLAAFDIEATGISTRTDRIVELAVVVLPPEGDRTTHIWRINPCMNIPKEVTAIHGISNEDVANCPTFNDLASEIHDVIKNCDLCGYNIERFDIPMLNEEFLRAGIQFDINDIRIIDAQRIFHKKEPRTLSAALQYYCNEEHTNAHGAEADVIATLSVIEGQYKMYDDLPQDMDALDEYCSPRDPSWVDRMGRLKWSDDHVVINFGKHTGVDIMELIQNDRGFINWILRSDFPRDTKEILEKAINGNLPEKKK